MNTTARPRAPRHPARITTLIIAAALSGTGILLAGCSSSGGASSASSASFGPAARSGAVAAGSHGSISAENGTAEGSPAAAAVPSANAPLPNRALDGQAADTRAIRLIPPSQSIVFTASITVQAKNVVAAASRAAAIVTADGGYTASEQETLKPGRKHALALVSLQLKIPVALYHAALRQLSALGTQTSLSQQAQDVTQQVADVSSRVTSAQAAITQLRALLRRAGSVGGLLSVQDQINSQESSLEALLAQQRALAHETTYATVSMRLVGHHLKAVHGKKNKQRHGFVGGLSAGWHALRLVLSGLLTALGAILPFVLIAALAGGIGYGARRRVVRRRSRPTPAQ